MTTTYYKATRPDGTDFYTGRVRYVLEDGSLNPNVTPLETVEAPKVCGPGVLHVSDTPSETLIGGYWPCRLFEVEGVGEVVDSEDHKHGFLSVRVVREIEAWRALGPNGQQVVELIDRARRLSADELDNLAAAWDAAWAAAGNAAWDAARAAAWAAAWDAAWAAARDAARAAAWAAAGNAAWDAAWAAAGNAAWYAARALTLRDLVGTGAWTQEKFDLLVGPWREAVGPLPGDES